MANRLLEMSLANNLPTFSGAEGENVEFFLKQINDVSALEKWSDTKKLLLIRLNCKEKALDFISNDPLASQASSAVSLQDQLRQKFIKKQTFAELQTNFSNIAQKPSQSVKQLAENIDQAANKYLNINNSADQQIRDLGEKIKLSKFFEALRNDIRIEVKKQNPKSFSQAIELATNIENALNDPLCQVNNTSSIEINTLIQSQIETNKRIMEISNQINEIKNPNREINNIVRNEQIANPPKEDIKCLICGKPHLTIKCWHFPGIKKAQTTYKQNKSNYQQNQNFRKDFRRGGNYRAHPYRKNNNLN